MPTPAIDTGSEADMTGDDMPKTDEERATLAGHPFYEIIGCLWWLAQMTRPDIFVALQRASKWVTKPSAKLWRWIKRIVQYLAGTRHLGLVYSRDKAAQPLRVYVDAAFADDEGCKSTAGWAIMCHGALIAYDSTTIKRVVTSSTEAECHALTIVGKENTWHRRVYQDLMNAKLEATPVLCDNTSTIAMLNTGVTRRSRHYEIEWFKMQDWYNAVS